MNPKLLIAEGNVAYCDLYGRFAAECGYEVETASDGLSCVERLRQFKPEVLVLDMGLSWGGGDGVLHMGCSPGCVSGKTRSTFGSC
jgi:CheY-like chemotaxis protein